MAAVVMSRLVIACPEMTTASVSGLYVAKFILSPFKAIQNIVKTTLSRIRTEEMQSESVTKSV